MFDGGGTDDQTAVSWPFRRHVTPQEPTPPNRIRLQQLHLAFPAGQTGGTRLVLTQSTYQLQRWLDWLDAHPAVSVVGDYSAASPAQSREAFARRGPWARIAVDVVPMPVGSGRGSSDDALHAAFAGGTPDERWSESQRRGAEYPDDPALQLAHASACMEILRLDDAEVAIERALTLAPDWEAAHYERGKLWLRFDDTGRAAASFAEAARLMPTFSAAFSNLGAALGELDRQEEALEALKQALRCDPFGHAILNNIGAAARDLGRLDEAERAFRQAIVHAPQFVFAHYNLGHTCFLQGRFADARDAYEAGLAADPQPGPRQRGRAALAHAAAHDFARAAASLEQALDASDDETRADVADEAIDVLRALAEVPGADRAALARLIDRVEKRM